MKKLIGKIFVGDRYGAATKYLNLIYFNLNMYVRIKLNMYVRNGTFIEQLSKYANLYN